MRVSLCSRIISVRPSRRASGRALSALPGVPDCAVARALPLCCRQHLQRLRRRGECSCVVWHLMDRAPVVSLVDRAPVVSGRGRQYRRGRRTDDRHQPCLLWCVRRREFVCLVCMCMCVSVMCLVWKARDTMQLGVGMGVRMRANMSRLCPCVILPVRACTGGLPGSLTDVQLH